MSTTPGPIRQFLGGTIRKLGGNRRTQVPTPTQANPGFRMPDEAVRVLRFLIEGDSTPLKLTVPIECDVSDLKELIQERAKPDLDGFADNRLILWKVCTL
jgi:hypothetical protein